MPKINWILAFLSVKLVTLATPNRNFSAFFKHLESKGIKFMTVIDVGIAFGSPSIYKSIPDAMYYLIEPVPACKPFLEKLSNQLNSKIFNVAAGSYNGEMDFFVHEDISGSSSYKQLEGKFFDGEFCKVPVRRLDGLISDPISRPSLLKIDTQGAELEVLSGATGILSEIDVLIIEVSFHEFRSGAPEFHDIVFRMHDLGYRCYEVLEGHYRYVDNALAQVDLVFVKEDSELRKIKSFFNDDQAKQYLNKT